MMTPDEERDFLNHWIMFGVAACVSKVGSRWRIWSGNTGHPLFKTKRAAMAMADQYALAISHRRAERRNDAADQRAARDAAQDRRHDGHDAPLCVGGPARAGAPGGRLRGPRNPPSRRTPAGQAQGPL